MTNNLSVETQNRLSPKIDAARQTAGRAFFETSWSWRHAGAAVGIVGGLLAGITGFFLTIIKSVEGNEAAAGDLGRMATFLIFLTIPMMIFGSYCLDKIEEKDKAGRVEYCQKNGRNGEEIEP